MTGRGIERKTARLLCAAALAALGVGPALAQTVPAEPPEAAELDPNAPLDAMPGIEVDWPTLDRSSDEAATPVAGEQSSAGDATAVAANGGELRYAVSIQGLGALGDATALLTAFNKSSTLEAGRKKPANAAQIDRRSRADAELLAELLRSRGYYDAEVEPRTERSGNALVVVLDAEPGEQYRFQSVELPGLAGRGRRGGQAARGLCGQGQATPSSPKT